MVSISIVLNLTFFFTLKGFILPHFVILLGIFSMVYHLITVYFLLRFFIASSQYLFGFVFGANPISLRSFLTVLCHCLLRTILPLESSLIFDTSIARPR